jgi:hypothetical protein
MIDKQKLRQQLEQLRAELQRPDSPEGPDRERLEQLAADVAGILERDEAEEHHAHGLTDGLQDALARLEASHPEATLRLRQLSDELAYLGI